MNRLSTSIAAIGLGLGSSGAMAFEATANVTFSWATDGVAKGWTSSAPNSLADVENSTYFTSLTGNNSTTYYNADFAKDGDPTGWCTPAEGGGFGQAQYSCKTAAVLPGTTPVADVGPGASAAGTLTVTDTTLTGTLTVIDTNDEGAGPQTGTTAATGYNVRSADGSPFKNVWYGVSGAATLTVNLTGTFTPTSWEIDGGTVTIEDPAFQCAFADFNGTLCNPSTVSGGFNANAEFLSWGLDAAGAGGVAEIEVRNATGADVLSTLSGVLASVNIDEGGNITTAQGEFRNGAGNNGQGCPTGSIRYSGTGVSCGTLQVGLLNITGNVALPEAPDPIVFDPQTGVAPETLVQSNTVTITGLTAPADISVTGGEYSIGCTAVFTIDAGTINNNEDVCVRQTSAQTLGTMADTILTVGGGSGTFSVTTIPADTTPDLFTFVEATEVALNTPTDSAPVTITGINTATPISVSAGGQYSVGCTASFTAAPGTVNNDEIVCVRRTSAAVPATTIDTVLTVGGVEGTFSVTTVTEAPDTQPDAFSFTDRNNAPLRTVVESNTVTISGINVPADITITGPDGSNSEYRINGGDWTSAAGTINATDTLQVRHTTSSVAGDAVVTVVTIGTPPPPGPGPNTSSRQAEFSSLTTPALLGGSSSMDSLAIGFLGLVALLRRRRGFCA